MGRHNPQPGSEGALSPVTLGIVLIGVALVTAGFVALSVDLSPSSDEDLSSSEASSQGLELSATNCPTGAAAFEPTVASTSNGTLFVQASLERIPGEAQRVHQAQAILRAWDGCGAWTEVTAGYETTANVSGEQINVGAPDTVAGERVRNPPTSGDPIVHVDSDTDRVFNLDMVGLNCNWITYSDDDGETWTTSPVACGQPPVQDHPTLFTGPPRVEDDATVMDQIGAYPNVVYICVNRLVDTGCARSLDGGLTFGPWIGNVFDGCGGLNGHGAVGPEGRIYLGASGCENEPLVAISEDDALSWTSGSIPGADRMYGHDVELAVDEAGNAYAVWTNGTARQPMLSVSTDHGESWTEPVAVAPEDVTTTSFRSVAASAEGHIAIAYYGSPAEMNNDSVVPDGAPWNTYLTVSTDAHLPEPTFHTAQTNAEGDPMARGPCNGDNRCTPHGPHETPVSGFSAPSPGDFIDVTIDDEGRPWAIFVDVCLDTCAEPDATEKAGHAAVVGTLSTGPSLIAGTEDLPPLAGR